MFSDEKSEMNTTIDNPELPAASPKQSFRRASSFGNESKIKVPDGGEPSVRAGLAYAREGARTPVGKLCVPRTAAVHLPFFI